MSEGGNDNGQQPAASLQTNELFELCKSESLSEEGVRGIIERHGLTHCNNLSDYKFFRAACLNERVTEEIIRCLLEYFPDAASAANNKGSLPLHFACWNKNMTVNIIQLIIDAAPDSVRSANNEGQMPLHILCRNDKLDGAAAIQILKLLLDKHPDAARHSSNNYGRLPIHTASRWRSPDFCRVLIEAYPGSERRADASDVLPLHIACCFNTVATVEYLYRQYPDAIHQATTHGVYPIDSAIGSTTKRSHATPAVDIVQFLLDCDPNQKLPQFHGMSPLHFACGREYNDSNIEAGIQIIKGIFDAHPEAIEDDSFASNIHRYHQRIQAFINNELAYARQAKDLRLMMTPDNNGRLPLHTALQNNVRLGSIKLLVKGNPSALRTVEDNLAMPLHIACEHHDSTRVVQYLLSLSATILDAVDREGNTVLHYACRGAKYETIALLLEKYDAASVSKQNAHGKLPIDMLWESNEVSDRKSADYVGSVFQLVRANPEMVAISNSTRDATRNGKKRKFSHDHD